MTKNRVCIIGQFPPPLHGLSIALQTIVNSEEIKEKYVVENIDIKNNKRIISNLFKIVKTDADLYYFTISQSLFGNLRDMLILKLILIKKKKVVIHYHGGYYKKLYDKMNIFQKKINKVLISKIDIMIALSNGLKKLFVDVINPEKVRVCENYIEDSSIMSDDEFKDKLSTIKNKDKIEVLYLSNFIESKGYKEVLKAASNFKDQQVLFHFAGAFFEKKDEVDFMQFIEENRLQSVVKYHGVVRGAHKKTLLMQSNIFVLPTYYPNEGQPISIIEAMGNGLMILTTSHAGIPDIVNENNGFLINPKAPDEIVNCLNHMLLNKDTLISFARENRKVTLEKFREIHYLERIQSIFDEVLEK